MGATLSRCVYRLDFRFSPFVFLSPKSKTGCASAFAAARLPDEGNCSLFLVGMLRHPFPPYDTKGCGSPILGKVQKQGGGLDGLPETPLLGLPTRQWMTALKTVAGSIYPPTTWAWHFGRDGKGGLREEIQRRYCAYQSHTPKDENPVGKRNGRTHQE